MADQLPQEIVVLLDEDGAAIGTADKATVHDEATPRHLGFSCYVFDRAGRFLQTRRATDKATFPGVLTNSLCGHPAPDEPVEDAVRRRARVELGLTLTELRLVLPAFSYRAEMDGTVENEACPVLIAVTDQQPAPEPAEVAEARWDSWPRFRDAVLDSSLAVSPWCREQVPLLAALGPDPLSWPTADPAELPPALRL